MQKTQTEKPIDFPRWLSPEVSHTIFYQAVGYTSENLMSFVLFARERLILPRMGVEVK